MDSLNNQDAESPDAESRQEKIREKLHRTREEIKSAYQCVTEVWAIPPEQIECIMQKLDNIDRDGIAFNQFAASKFPRILQSGLLGNSIDKRHHTRGSIDPEQWKTSVRNQNAIVHFNITGRERFRKSVDQKKTTLGISCSHWMQRPGNACILFDLSGFQELVPRFKETQQLLHTFRANTPSLPQGFHDFPLDTAISDPKLKKFLRQWHTTEDGKPIVEGEFGFVLNPRIAPRRFMGIVFCPGRLNSEEEIQQNLTELKKYIHERGIEDTAEADWLLEKEEFGLRHGDDRYSERTDDPLNIQRQAEELASVQLYVNRAHPERLLPIYDTKGNLCWPVKMSYQEIQEYLQSRETK